MNNEDNIKDNNLSNNEDQIKEQIKELKEDIKKLNDNIKEKDLILYQLKDQTKRNKKINNLILIFIGFIANILLFIN